MQNSDTQSVDALTMIVANGRTVHTGNGFKIENRTMMQNGQPTVVSYQVPVDGKTLFTEGEEVTLPRAEALRLHEAGFLRNADEPNSRPLGAHSGGDFVNSDPNAIGLAKVTRG